VTSNNDVIIRCESLTKAYGDFVALKDLDLAVSRGHIFGYIGHNGAGKTTTIRILAGLLKQTSGKASIAGTDCSVSRDRLRQVVGYLPDSFGVYDRMRVWEYLDFYGAAFKLPKKFRRDRIDYVLDVTEAEYMRDRFVDALSRGMKQRVGIARTLLHDPDVLLLDEPASGLDPEARVHMRHLLRRLADSGKALLVSSHILPELAAVCDGIGIIHQGVLRASGAIQDVLNRLRRDRAMELKVLGDPSRAASVVEAREHCSQIDLSDEVENLVRFRYSGNDEGQAQLLTALMGEGLGIVSLREIPLSLEEAYLAVSGISSEIPETGEDAGEQKGPDA